MIVHSFGEDNNITLVYEDALKRPQSYTIKREFIRTTPNGEPTYQDPLQAEKAAALKNAFHVGEKVWAWMIAGRDSKKNILYRWELVIITDFPKSEWATVTPVNCTDDSRTTSIPAIRINKRKDIPNVEDGYEHLQLTHRYMT